MRDFEFLSAKPVWAAHRETELNFSLALRAVLPAGADALLHIAGHTNYQIFINGAFFAQGPARAGHGFFRVDELELQSALTAPENVVCVLAAGYNVNSFYLTDQPSFICAEIVSGGVATYATGTADDFAYTAFTYRVQKVQRFSFQRPFTEVYRFDRDYDRFFTDPAFTAPALPVARTAPGRFIARETLRSDYEERFAQATVSMGTAKPSERRSDRFRDRSFTHVDGVSIKGFPPDMLEIASANEVYGLNCAVTDFSARPAGPAPLAANAFAVYDMGVNTSGYIRLVLTPAADVTVWAVFNERLPADGVPDPGADNCACEVCWALQGGRTYVLTSFEPYTYRYLQVISLGGDTLVESVSQICEHYPAAGLKPAPQLGDAALKKIFDAAVETFRQNATDIFMDCPSRERAGWLCDSFFTSRTERVLTGESRIEKAFLENFLMEPSFPDLPVGMLPMCYPSDHPDGCYIPNWAMWYLIELAEYEKRTGDTALVARAKEKMYALAAFFETYENEYGLLEKLDSWVFVEWSRANDFTQDVNFPTNMLYAKFLSDLGALYGDEALIAKADRLKETIRALAFDGTFFIDNALRKNGELALTENHTETAQYYAFFTGTATKETHPALFELMIGRFGPGRDPETEYPDVPVSNAFIGNYLRLEILFREGMADRLEDEIRAFFLPMAEATGTLWENMHSGASCCHGFASHVACWLNALYGGD